MPTRTRTDTVIYADPSRVDDYLRPPVPISEADYMALADADRGAFWEMVNQLHPTPYLLRYEYQLHRDDGLLPRAALDQLIKDHFTVRADWLARLARLFRRAG